MICLPFDTSDESSNNEEDNNQSESDTSSTNSVMLCPFWNEDVNFKQEEHSNKSLVERIKNDLKKSEEKESHQICLLIDNYSCMSSDFISLINAHEIDIWPELCGKYESTDAIITAHYLEYRKLLRSKINCSEVLIAFVTNTFCTSKEGPDMIKYAKQKKKPIIGLIVEEIENYDALKSTLLNGFSYYCEIFKERINPVGYDQYLWVSECFEDMIEKLDEILNGAFHCNIPDFRRYRYSLFFFHTIHNDDHVGYVNNLYEQFKKVKGDTMYYQIDDDNYTRYIDLQKYNISEKLGRDYEQEKAYEFFEAKLETCSIHNKKDFLNLIQHLDRLIDFKFNEFIESRDSDDCATETMKRLPIIKYARVESRIRLKMKSWFNFAAPGDYDEEDDYTVKLVYKYVKDEFKKLKIELSLVHKILTFFHHLDYDDRGYYEVYNSDAVVFALFKEFYESGKFEQIVKNFTSCYKLIYIVKYEDFQVDPKSYKVASEAGCFKGIYDLHRNKEDDYEGYELRRLFTNIRDNIEGAMYDSWEDEATNKPEPLIVEKLILRVKYDICIIGSITENDHISELERILKDEEKLCLKVNLKNEDALENIEKSKIILFVLTNDYCNSKKFESEYKLARKEIKVIIFILLERITPNKDLEIDFKALNVIKLYRYTCNGSMWKGEVFNRLSFMIHSALRVNSHRNSIPKQYKHRERHSTIVQSIHLRKIFKSNMLRGNTILFDFEENNHLLAANGKHIHVFDRNTFNFIKTIDSPRKLNAICCMTDSKKLILMSNNGFYIMDADYQKTELLIEFSGPVRREFTFIQYSEEEQMYYVYDKARNIAFSEYLVRGELTATGSIEYLGDEVVLPPISIEKGIKDMKLMSSYVYFLLDNSVLVYDLNLEPVAKFGDSVLKEANVFMMGSRMLEDLILIASNRSIYFFGLNNYECYAEIEREGLPIKAQSIFMINNNSLVLFENNELRLYQLFYTDRDRLKLKLEDSCVCKMDPFKPHLLLNPYILPSANIACLECIYKNYKYNLDVTKFKQSNVIEINLNTICQQIIHHARHLSENEMLDCFNNYFDLLENNIDIRFESVMTCFDELEAKALTQVDELEERLIKRSKSSSTSNNDGKHAKLEHELNACFKNWPFQSFKHIKKLEIGDIGPLSVNL